jgi:hypothetical protein
MGEGAWKTGITLVNLDANQSNTVILKFHNGQSTPAGQGLVLENGTLASDGTYYTSLNPDGSTTISTSGMTGTSLWQGWVEIASSTTLGGFAVFRQSLKVGQIEGTVSFTPRGSERFVVPFGADTGLALVNTSDQAATISASFRDATGAAIAGVPNAQTTLPLVPAAHMAFQLEDPAAPLGGIGLAQLSGVADLTSTQAGLIGIGLRFTDRHAFTSLPIILK